MTVSKDSIDSSKDENLTIQIDFENLNEYYFPENCVICGKTTDERYLKAIIGKFSSEKDYKKNYYFSLPVCKSCKPNVEMKTGLSNKYGKISMFSIIAGVILSILLYFLFLSIFLSLGIFLASILIPLSIYKVKTRTKIKLDKYIAIKIDPDDTDTIEMTISDGNYGNSLKKINADKLKEQEKQEVLPDPRKSDSESTNAEKDDSETKTPIDSPSMIKKDTIRKEDHPTVLVCPNCKIKIKQEWEFCSNCGAILKDL